jgi:glycosyltransferase involved in cell wall biosynthesis
MKISVAMCTYNGEQFIKEQINSILNQTLKVDEIVVCDDGSNDNTIEILNQYSINNPTIFKIHQNKKNLKSVKNFEKAICLCSGDIIFLSDQDDMWCSNKVEKIAIYFKENQNIDVLATNGYCIDENSTVQEKYSVWDVPEFLREENIEFDYFKIISYIGNIATGASMAFRKKIITDVIPLPIIESYHHDEWISINAAQKNKFELLNEKLFYYRIHQNQQIGGVFFDKNVTIKNMLINTFNYHSSNLSMKNYKKKLKKNCESYSKNKKLRDFYLKNNLDDKKIDFQEILNDIENLFYKTKKDFKKKNIIKFYFISLFDNLLQKRQLIK